MEEDNFNVTKFVGALIGAKCYDVVANNTKKFLANGADANEMVDMLIEEKQVGVVARCIDDYLDAGVDANKLTDALIAEGYKTEVVKKFEKFKAFGADIDVERLAKTFIGYFGNKELEDNLDVFLTIGATKLANILIEYGGRVNGAGIIVRNFGKFLAEDANIDATEPVNILIEKGYACIVADNLDTLRNAKTGIDVLKIAEVLIVIQDDAKTVIKNLKKFFDAGMNATKLADMLIEAKYAGMVADNLYGFLAAGAGATKLVNRLIEEGYIDEVFRIADKLQDFGVDVAKVINKLVKGKYRPDARVARMYHREKSRAIINNLDKLRIAGIDMTKLTDMLIENGYSYCVGNNLYEFQAAGANINMAKLADRLIGDEVIAIHLDQYLIDPDINMSNLISNLTPADISHINIDKILDAGVNATEFARVLIEQGCSHQVFDHLEKFRAAGADLIKLANMWLIEEKDHDKAYRTDYLNKLLDVGADTNKLVNIFIGTGNAEAVIHCLDELWDCGADIDLARLVNILIKEGHADTVNYYLGMLLDAGACIDMVKLANALIEKEKYEELLSNLEIYQDAGVDIDATVLADKLIEQGHASKVLNNFNRLKAAGAEIDKVKLTNGLIEEWKYKGEIITHNLDAIFAIIAA